jgi:hypothetical protein
VNWPNVMRNELDNGRDPNAMATMPATRFVALYFPPTQADVFQMANIDRAEKGLAPLEVPDERGAD